MPTPPRIGSALVAGWNLLRLAGYDRGKHQQQPTFCRESAHLFNEVRSKHRSFFVNLRGFHPPVQMCSGIFPRLFGLAHNRNLRDLARPDSAIQHRTFRPGPLPIAVGHEKTPRCEIGGLDFWSGYEHFWRGNGGMLLRTGNAA